MSTFELLSPRPQAPLPIKPYYSWRALDGEVLTQFFHTEGGYLLRFPGAADFSVTSADGHTSSAPVPGAPARLIDSLFQNQVLPLILSRRGEIVLHASAVATGQTALAFVGRSGSGKSTLAAGFARGSNPVITDDKLVLRNSGAGYTAMPDNSSIRLWADSEAGVFNRPARDWTELPEWKTQIAPGPQTPFRDRPSGLRSIYLLGPGDCPRATIQPIEPAKALTELIRHTFILDVEDRPSLRANFDRLAGVANAVPCFALDYPRRYDVLPVVLETVLDHASSGADAQ